MYEYFKLQIRMLARKLADFGIHPLLGFPFIVLFFLFGSYLLFEKTQFATPVYVALALFYVSKTNNAERNNFLRIIFKQRLYYRIRMLENLLIVFPFAGFLIFNHEINIAVLLIIISVLLAFVELRFQDNLVIPTPFHKKPFEFLLGFRKWYYIIGIAWFLTIMAILHLNLNLGIFSMLLVYALSISFYMKPENPYFVWNHKHRPLTFLWVKIKMALLQSLLLVLPILIALMIFYSGDIKILLVFFVLGNIFLLAGVLAKYASYPNEMHAPYLVLLILAAFFPLLLLAIIPFFYWKSRQHLNEYLK